MFTMLGLCVSFDVSQPVGRDLGGYLSLDRLLLALGSFFQHEEYLTHRESSRSVSLSLSRKKVGLFLKTISCGSQFLKRSPRERTKVALGAVVHVAVLTVSMKLAPA